MELDWNSTQLARETSLKLQSALAWIYSPETTPTMAGAGMFDSTISLVVKTMAIRVCTKTFPRNAWHHLQIMVADLAAGRPTSMNQDLELGMMHR